MLRVGRCKYNHGQRTDPSFEGFTSIVVLTRSTNEWGVIGPYCLKDEKGRIMENSWQGSKVYSWVPKTREKLHRNSPIVIWEHPEEVHVDSQGELTPRYFAWRQKLMNNKHAVRYPVGFHHRHRCLYALDEVDGKVIEDEHLDYVTARKRIYVREYCRLVKKHPKFKELQQRLKHGENLLIIEVDGPHQESLNYYKRVYGVNDDFIQQDTMMINQRNIEIMLNDVIHPFGHGYCLGMALLNKEVEWNR